ncbi:uncharacterized protein LOC118183575, partial [Stegodyphus dumicola]|uniref:uncharacterized protein LOC118183575 n=1 Tax=Stegodyphus dumicola TaxID=202533 RepID=UPI0015B3358C
MEFHIERVLRPKGSNSKVHYLSKDSQNEMLQIIGSSIREKILLSLRKAKYYSIILDCTPDISKTEQMSAVIRFVLCSDRVGEIKEHFLGFIKVDDSTGNGLCETVMEMLKMWNIPLDDMRGQGINPVSKQLQEKGLSVTLALKAISNLKTFIEEYRSDINYKSILEKAKELSEEVDGEPQFKTVEEVRRREKKFHFDYEHADESPQSPEEKFRANVFFRILDTAWTSLNERFDAMKNHWDNFSFL